jgi:hypothetical protein
MKTTRITVSARSPRNPFVAAARLRRAGAHGPGRGGQRQQARRELQRELQPETQRQRPSP